MTSAISIKNLCKNYGDLKAVDDISLDIKKGEFFALLGPNGAGKTTTINIISSLTNKTKGTIRIFDHDLEKESIEAKKLIGIVPQEFSMDMFEIVEKFLFFNAGYYGVPRFERKKRIDEVLELTGLEEKRKMKIMTLSGGMKRKLMIARSLLHQPKILILDEPTAGVDVETRQHMWKFLKKLNKQSKTTFLLTTHYIEEAEQLCDKIAIIQNGKIIACDTKNKIMKNFGKEELVFTLKEQITEKSETKIKKVLINYKIKIDKNNNQIKINISSKKVDYNKLLKIIQQFNIKNISTEEKNLERIFVELTNVYS